MSVSENVFENVKQNDVYVINGIPGIYRSYVYRFEIDKFENHLVAKPYIFGRTVSDPNKYELSQYNIKDITIGDLNKDIRLALIVDANYIGNIEDKEKLKSIVLLTEIQQTEEWRLSLVKEKERITGNINNQLKLLDEHLAGLSSAITREVLLNNLNYENPDKRSSETV